MPEYFELSLIAPRTAISKAEMEKCLSQLNLSEGRHIVEAFENRELVVDYFEFEETDFDETCISFPDQVFRRESLDEEISKFTHLVARCFAYNSNLQYALCSYELNACFMNNVRTLQDFSEDVLKKFPLVYARDKNSNQPLLSLNLEAQDIFTQSPFFFWSRAPDDE